MHFFGSFYIENHIQDFGEMANWKSKMLIRKWLIGN